MEKVKIYSSRAKGNYKKGSDIDFALWLTNNGEITKISEDLDELPTPYKFDAVNYKALTHQGLKTSIDKDGKLLYKK